MRNHSKADKEKNKLALRAKTPKKVPAYGNHSAVLKKIKEMTTNETPMECAETPAVKPTQECIFLDAGSKKSYIDLTESKSAAEIYPRISVIRTVGSQSPPALKSEQFEFYQEKPVDFSPKHKYKTDYKPNQYATMVV